MRDYTFEVLTLLAIGLALWLVPPIGIFLAAVRIADLGVGQS